MAWIEDYKRRLRFFSSTAPQTSPLSAFTREFSSTSFSKMLGKSFPKKSTRYLHAMGAMGFLVSVVSAMDWMTTTQLKNSPYFEYSFKAVTLNKDVQELLGTPIRLPWRVSVKKHKSRFQLTYTLKGQDGNWAQVVAASTIDPKRGAITDDSFRYIVVQPTNLRNICFGVVTDGLYDLAAIIGKDHWFSETEEQVKKRRANEILVVDRVTQPSL
jgi:hypothetical protein